MKEFISAILSSLTILISALTTYIVNFLQRKKVKSNAKNIDDQKNQLATLITKIEENQEKLAQIEANQKKIKALNPQLIADDSVNSNENTES